MKKRLRRNGGWVTVERGFFVQGVNAASIAGYLDFDAPHYLLFQLYNAETGRPSDRTYRGQGEVVNRGGRKHLILGDAQWDARLDEYIIEDRPDPESDKNLDDYIEGLKAGVSGKRKSARGGAWLDGFNEGRANKGKR